jgi:acyl-coenzyme A thioesterase PaaI-like protein
MPASLAVTPQELHRLLHEVAFTRQYGFRLEAIAVGACTLFVPFQEAFERPGGVVSGQVFMTAADVAMWLAIMTQLGITDGSLTVEMTSAFLQGAKREDFRCTATILRLGKRLVYGVAECVNIRGTRLSHHTLTYARPAQDAVRQA